MNIKIKLLVVIALTLGACSTQSPIAKKTTESRFVGGGITILYTKDGELDGISSTASAPVSSDLQLSINRAVSVATLKARRQIAEFLETEVHSDRFLSTVSLDLQSSQDGDKVPDSSKATNLAVSLRESIRQQSNQILRGTVVEKESFDAKSNVVTVVVRSKKADREASGLLKQLFSK